VKFGKLLATETQLDFGEDSLPVIIVYKGGELVTSVVKFTDNFGFNFDYDDVLDFLKEYATFRVQLVLLLQTQPMPVQERIC